MINSAELHLEQIIQAIREAHAQGQDVARVHSGDPSLYGAIGEQIRCLQELEIPFEIVPGVTATAACAALLGAELTLPDVSQSVILTRYADKTSMPAGEEFASLAAHGATMAIHLGVNHMERIVAELLPTTAPTAPSQWCTGPPGRTRTGYWEPWRTSPPKWPPRASGAPR